MEKDETQNSRVFDQNQQDLRNAILAVKNSIDKEISSASGTPPPDLGKMDLGLLLRSTGRAVAGYVDMGASQVFTVEHTIMVTPAPVGTPGPGYAPAPVAQSVTRLPLDS